MDPTLLLTLFGGDKTKLNPIDIARQGVEFQKDLSDTVYDTLSFLSALKRDVEIKRDYYKKVRRGIEGNVDYFAYGGKNTSPKQDEVEGGEVVVDSEGVKKVKGKKHEQGGVKTNLEPGSKVLSDRLKVGAISKQLKMAGIKAKPSDTFADVMNHFLDSLKLDEYEKALEPYLKTLEKVKDIEDLTTKELNEKFLAKKIDKVNKKYGYPLERAKKVAEVLFALQEELKKQKGISNTDGHYAVGGEKELDGGPGDFLINTPLLRYIAFGEMPKNAEALKNPIIIYPEINHDTGELIIPDFLKDNTNPQMEYSLGDVVVRGNMGGRKTLDYVDTGNKSTSLNSIFNEMGSDNTLNLAKEPVSGGMKGLDFVKQDMKIKGNFDELLKSFLGVPSQINEKGNQEVGNQDGVVLTSNTINQNNKPQEHIVEKVGSSQNKDDRYAQDFRFPNQWKLPPSPQDFELKQSVEPRLLEKVKINPEQGLKYLFSALSTVMGKTNDLPDAASRATKADILSESEAKVLDYLDKVNSLNVKNAISVENINSQIKQKTDFINEQFLSNYDAKVKVGADNTEQEWRNWMDYNQKLRLMEYKLANLLNNVNSRMDNYYIDEDFNIRLKDKPTQLLLRGTGLGAYQQQQTKKKKTKK